MIRRARPRTIDLTVHPDFGLRHRRGPGWRGSGHAPGFLIAAGLTGLAILAFLGRAQCGRLIAEYWPWK